MSELNSTVSVETLLSRLQSMQSSQSSKYFPAQLFIGQRRNPYFFYDRQDNNVFFTAAIALTLQQAKANLPGIHLPIITDIVESCITAFDHYLDKSTGFRYNFYPKRSGHQFRNGNILHRFKYFELADDVDDTSIIHLVNIKHQLTEATLAKAKNAIEFYRTRTLSKSESRSHLPESHQKYLAHGTWCGSDRMTLVYDFCVMCNALLLFEALELESTSIELDSYDFINRCLETGDLWKHPYQTSNYYADPVISLYHAARLYEKAPERMSYDSLTESYEQIQNQASNLIQQLMMATSALRLGLPSNSLVFSMEQLKEDSNQHSYFIAPMLGSTTSGLLNALAPLRISWLTYHCEAYGIALALEYLAFAKAD